MIIYLDTIIIVYSTVTAVPLKMIMVFISDNYAQNHIYYIRFIES